jgi:PAS domain S-box-containing protein
MEKDAEKLIAELEKTNKKLQDEIAECRRAEEALRESEKRYKYMVNTIPDSITVCNLEGIVIFTSPQTARMHGYSSPEELLGKRITELIAPQEHEKTIAMLEKIRRDGISKDIQHSLIRKDGSAFQGEISSTLIRDEFSKQEMILSIARDITERKQAEDSIRHLATFPQLTPVLIIEFNVKEEVLFINPAMKAVQEQRSIQEPRQFIPPEWSRRLLEPLSIEKSMDIQEITIAGRVFDEHISFIEEFQTLRIYATDITETKRLEEEREKLIDELQDALAQIKTLQGILPICMFCKKIRDDKNYWHRLEAYISDHSETQFSHGVCPECAKKHGYD